MGVAVKVTILPSQAGLAEAAMDTLTGIAELMVIIIAFDVAGFPVAQGAALEVSTQITTSLSDGIYE